jgi:hypothetical protein
MTCYQSSTVAASPSVKRAVDRGLTRYTTEADCLQACKEGACCEGTTCSVKPQCQCVDTSLGSCCGPDAYTNCGVTGLMCRVETKAACDQRGGVWRGGTSCSADEKTGVCPCSTSVTPLANPSAPVFKGVGTTCTPNPCPCCGCFGCYDTCDRYSFRVSNVGPALSDICACLLKDRHGEITISVPAGMQLPVRVTINGFVDDDLVVNGAVISPNNPAWRFPPPWLGDANTPRCNGAHQICHSFDLSDSSFTMAAQNNFVHECAYDVRVCFCQNPLP